ncbi:MAG: DUF4258 domain-containing protein [bacterium]|nr:DUF4258 domain-containing protein [bacterium]
MEWILTAHARHTMAERGVSVAWVQRTVEAPALPNRDPYDEEVEGSYLPIAERGNRVLRVALNVTSDPWRAVTVFFDRATRGEL